VVFKNGFFDRLIATHQLSLKIGDPNILIKPKTKIVVGPYRQYAIWMSQILGT
jgi:hypothetical protein